MTMTGRGIPPDKFDRNKADSFVEIAAMSFGMDETIDGLASIVELDVLIQYNVAVSASMSYYNETAGSQSFENCYEALSADYAIPISGDSMEPDFSSGNIVPVKSCPGVSEGEIGIFVLDGEAYIKEYKAAVCLGLVLGKTEVIE